MKLLCISDQRDPLVYSAAAKVRFAGIDMVLSAGDLDLDYYGFIVSMLNKPLLFVFGNHNLKNLNLYRPIDDVITRVSQEVPSVLLPSYGATYIGGTVARARGLLIAGLGGSRKYNNGLNQFTERQMFWKIVKLIPRLLFNRVFRGRYLDILLTHAPPEGIGDMPDACHRGFHAFLWFMRTFKPRYLLHGHIHLYDMNAPRERRYAETTIINVFSSYTLEIEVPDGV